MIAARRLASSASRDTHDTAVPTGAGLPRQQAQVRGDVQGHVQRRLRTEAPLLDEARRGARASRGSPRGTPPACDAPMASKGTADGTPRRTARAASGPSLGSWTASCASRRRRPSRSSGIRRRASRRPRRINGTDSRAAPRDGLCWPPARTAQLSHASPRRTWTPTLRTPRARLPAGGAAAGGPRATTRPRRASMSPAPQRDQPRVTAQYDDRSHQSSLWGYNISGAFVANRRVDLRAIDATSARLRGDAGPSPRDFAGDDAGGELSRLISPRSGAGGRGGGRRPGARPPARRGAPRAAGARLPPPRTRPAARRAKARARPVPPARDSSPRTCRSRAAPGRTRPPRPRSPRAPAPRPPRAGSAASRRARGLRGRERAGVLPTCASLGPLLHAIERPPCVCDGARSPPRHRAEGAPSRWTAALPLGPPRHRRRGSPKAPAETGDAGATVKLVGKASCAGARTTNRPGPRPARDRAPRTRLLRTRAAGTCGSCAGCACRWGLPYNSRRSAARPSRAARRPVGGARVPGGGGP